MVTGDPGSNGLAALWHVDQELEAGQESVTTQLQLMEVETVRDQAVSQEFVTQMLVQMKPGWNEIFWLNNNINTKLSML